MDITGVGSSSYLYGYGISDSDTKNVTGKENGIGSVDENGKQKECQTCKNRKYVDGSDEANVSFKSAAHVSPQAASSAVRAHEGQHVSNAYSKASEENGRVIFGICADSYFDLSGVREVVCVRRSDQYADQILQ